jgi:hypothetical protein
MTGICYNALEASLGGDFDTSNCLMRFSSEGIYYHSLFKFNMILRVHLTYMKSWNTEVGFLEDAIHL